MQQQVTLAGLKEHRRLSCTEPDPCPMQLNVVYTDWQQLSRVSGMGLPRPVGRLQLGTSVCKTRALLLSHSPFLIKAIRRELIGVK